MSENEVKTTLTDEWGSFTAIPNEFIHMAGELQEQSRWLFVLLRHYTNSETKTAFPSYAEIKHKTGWAFNTIAKAIRDLEEHGWLIRKKQFSGNTHYTLIRKSKSVKSLPEASNDQSLPEASNDQSLRAASTSEPQVQSLRAARPVLASRKPIKTEITKTKNTKKDTAVANAPVDKISSRQPDSFYESFAQAYQSAYGCPYQHKAADFIQLSNCRKQGGSWLTPDRWQHALSNYFLSEIGTHTLADFSTRFGSFYRGVLDRFNKPVEVNSNGTIKQPVRETAGGRAARETLELIRQLTGQDGFDSGFDTENPRALIPAVVDYR